MSDELNKDVHEQIMGKCVHEFGNSESLWRNHHSEKLCIKCNNWFHWAEIDRPSYLDWSNYGPLLERLQEDELWPHFLMFVAPFHDNPRKDVLLMLLTPSRGLPLIHKFFCKGEK
jgi:hypothetical protein